MTFLNYFLLIVLQIPSFNAIRGKFTAFQQSPGVSGGTVAISVKNCRTGRYEVGFNEDKLVNAASTLKLVTTATALEILGKDFRYKTTFAYSGNIVNGKLTGDLYLYSDGDPTFAAERWGTSYDTQVATYTNVIKKLGVSEIAGNVVMMDTGVEDFDVADTWAWYDLGNYYGATPFKFNFNENMFSVYFNAGSSVGQPAKLVDFKPFSTGWQIVNQVTTGAYGSGDNVYLYSTPLSNTILMKGTVPLKATSFGVKGSLPNPALVFGELMVNGLRNNGVTVSGRAIMQSNSATGLKILSTQASVPLNELAASCNYFSINLVADALLKKLGQVGEKSYTYEKGLEALKGYWQGRGIDVSALNSKDGSGLSPMGTISARVMADILREESRSALYPTFTTTIPKLGVSGTVARIGRGTKAQGRVFVKSGSIEATRAYAGYFTTSGGELMSFMICANRYNEEAKNNVRKFLEGILVDFGSM